MDTGHGVVVIGSDAEGIETQAVFAEPEEWAVALGCGLYRCMGDCGSRAKNDGGNGSHWQRADEAICRDPLDGGVIHLHPAVLEINGSPAILGWSEGFQRWAFKDGHKETSVGRFALWCLFF